MTSDAKNCVVLVPHMGRIDAVCERGLRELEKRGYEVRRVSGLSLLDQARSQLATEALAGGFDEIMWIDADVGFMAEHVDHLRSHNLPIVCGVYVKKGPRALACHLLPETKSITFGREGGLTEICYAPTGFLLTHRQVYEDVQRRLELPTCNTRFGKPIVPYFLSLIVPDGDGHWYLGEDFAFCERARRCGYQIWADTSIRLWHFGSYGYSWEDAGADTTRYATYHYRLKE